MTILSGKIDDAFLHGATPLIPIIVARAGKRASDELLGNFFPSLAKVYTWMLISWLAETDEKNHGLALSNENNLSLLEAARCFWGDNAAIFFWIWYMIFKWFWVGERVIFVYYKVEYYIILLQLMV